MSKCGRFSKASSSALPPSRGEQQGSVFGAEHFLQDQQGDRIVVGGQDSEIVLHTVVGLGASSSMVFIWW